MKIYDLKMGVKYVLYAYYLSNIYHHTFDILPIFLENFYYILAVLSKTSF